MNIIAKMIGTNVKNINSGGKTHAVYGIERYDALDGLRALACICIVLMHVMSNMNVLLSSNWLTTKVIPFAGNFVLLFMMLSAFSVSCGYYDRIKTGLISPNDFYKKRYMRILPFFGLLVAIDVLQTFIVEKFSLSASMKAELYEAYADLTLAFGFLPDADINVIGVGWFLGVIFLFYMIYPFFTFLLHTKRRAWIVFAIVIGFYYVVREYFVEIKGCVGGSSNIILCLPYFILGGIIYLYRNDIVNLAARKLMRVAVNVWLMVLVLIYSVVFFAFSLNEVDSSLFFVLLLYGLWLIYAVAENSKMNTCTLLNNKVMKFFSNISMEIYLCHMMFFRIVEMCHIERYLRDDDLRYWITSILVFTGAVIFSLTYKCLEKRVEMYLSATSTSKHKPNS